MISEVNRIRFVQIGQMTVNLASIASVEWMEQQKTATIRFISNESKTFEGYQAEDIRGFFELVSLRLAK